MVDAAKSPDPAGPNRTSLPSVLPPAWSAVISWLAPTLAIWSLPPDSNPIATAADAAQRMNIAANTTQPIRWFLAMRPKA